MRKYDVQMAFIGYADARAQWRKGKREFEANAEKVLRRLLHEAAVNYMSVEEVSKASGLSQHKVRQAMNRAGLGPNLRRSKTLLAKTAAEALVENSELLGMAPHEMDLMSPLAYLPAGQELRQAITDKTTAGVTELSEYEHADATQLAGKLDDAGIEWADAREWVNEVITRGELIP